jgi:small subunit ribosomal protein S13
MLVHLEKGSVFKDFPSWEVLSLTKQFSLVNVGCDVLSVYSNDTVHFLGTPLQKNWSVVCCLLQVGGFGWTNATSVCFGCGVLPKTPWRFLTGAQVSALGAFISSSPLLFGNDLKRSRLRVLEGFVTMGSRRGIRLRLGLPVRGQNTHSNAKNSKKCRSF